LSAHLRTLLTHSKVREQCWRKLSWSTCDNRTSLAGVLCNPLLVNLRYCTIRNDTFHWQNWPDMENWQSWGDLFCCLTCSSHHGVSQRHAECLLWHASLCFLWQVLGRRMCPCSTSEPVERNDPFLGSDWTQTLNEKSVVNQRMVNRGKAQLSLGVTRASSWPVWPFSGTLILCATSLRCPSLDFARELKIFERMKIVGESVFPPHYWAMLLFASCFVPLRVGIPHLQQYLSATVKLSWWWWDLCFEVSFCTLETYWAILTIDRNKDWSEIWWVFLAWCGGVTDSAKAQFPTRITMRNDGKSKEKCVSKRSIFAVLRTDLKKE